jgi:hypothetical protein
VYSSSFSPALASSTTGLAAGAFTSPVWGLLAGFAMLAACSALARIVPRPGTLRRV